MAGRQPAPPHELQGESSTMFLDHYQRRASESGDHENAAAATAATAATASLPSPTNSIAALVSNYDDLSPNPGANPWQYLSTSDPSSPTSQREYYNQLTQSSTLFPSSHFQRDLVAEYPWMQEVLEQQLRAANSQAQGVESRSRALDVDMDWQRSSRGAIGHSGGHNHHAAPTAPIRGNLIRRRREQTIDPAGPNSAPDHGGEGTEAFLYEEAAWYRNCGYLRPDLAYGEGLHENFTRLDSSGTHNLDHSGSPAQLDYGSRNVDPVRMRWERPGIRPSQFVEPSGTHRERAEMEPEMEPEMEAGALPRASRALPSMTVVADPVSANSQETSLSSETNGDDSGDDEECTRSFGPPPGSSVVGDGDCSGKRKTPEASGEEPGDDSARQVSSEIEPKRTSSSGRILFQNVRLNRPRERSANAKPAGKPREPRYAIKTRTDVDIMDDGFKWRKYGQKAVKNSPYPRNYYRCTTPHCPVRKRVERSHEDSGLVITTYEGTHTHLTPGSHRPGGASSAGYFTERLRSAAGDSPALERTLPRSVPLPPEFSLAALHHMRALRSLQTLAQHQIAGSRTLLPGSLQRDSLLRAQQFLGLHDATSFGSVKQEPFPFTDFMASRSSASHALPYPGPRHFPPPGPPFLDRMQQMKWPARGTPSPRHLRPMQPDLDSYPDFPTDTDLVRRVLEAESEQELSGGDGPSSNGPDHDIASGNSSTFNHGGAAAPPPVSPRNFARSRAELERLRAFQSRPQPPLRRSKAGGSSDNLVAAGMSQLVQEMVDRPQDR